MARSGADLELLQAAMSGEPAADAIVAPRLATVLTDGLDAVAGAAFSRALEAVAATGATIAGADLRLVAESRAAGWTVLCYEAALAMAPHLDAIRAAPTSFLKYADRGAGISRTDYEAALATGRAFADAVDAVLGDADALITPCAPFAPPRADDPDLGAKTPLMGEMFLPFSLSGHPAVVVPLRVDGAVVPVQLVGRTGGDAALVALARGIAA